MTGKGLIPLLQGARLPHSLSDGRPQLPHPIFIISFAMTASLLAGSALPGNRKGSISATAAFTQSKYFLPDPATGQSRTAPQKIQQRHMIVQLGIIVQSGSISRSSPNSSQRGFAVRPAPG